LFQPIDRAQDLLMEPAHRDTRLTQAAVLCGPPADAGALGYGDRADARAACFAPGKNSGGMAPVAVPGAVAGGMAAPRPELVNGAFQQVPNLKDLAELAAIVGHQFPQDLALAAGVVGRTHGMLLAFEPNPSDRIKAPASRSNHTLTDLFRNVQRKVRVSSSFLTAGRTPLLSQAGSGCIFSLCSDPI
jgi:hypothetical protein